MRNGKVNKIQCSFFTFSPQSELGILLLPHLARNLDYKTHHLVLDYLLACIDFNPIIL